MEGGEHPYHNHPLVKADTRDVYRSYDGRWKCDICHKSYDGRSDDTKQRYSYHCYQCHPPSYFDACHDCYRGYHHPYHTHRLQPAKHKHHLMMASPEDSEGYWKCSACLRGFSYMTNTTSYYCNKCSIDICKDCFDGQWKTVIHHNGDHPLTPVDPRILYRLYGDWYCEVCQKVWSHGPQLQMLYHCNTCNEDICPKCFKGHTHHLHQHGLVIDPAPSTTPIICSHCRHYPSLYRCRIPTCHFYLCQMCFHGNGKPHPLHPSHVLYLTDASLAYPDSGGLWHCDNCTDTSPTVKALTSSDVMYHCSICQYDLCQKCYREKDLLPRLQTPPSNQVQNYFLSNEQIKRPIVTRPSINYIPASTVTSFPAPGLCCECGLASAHYSPSHGGLVHPDALYCYNCSQSILQSRERCHKCGQLPDNMIKIT